MKLSESKNLDILAKEIDQFFKDNPDKSAGEFLLIEGEEPTPRNTMWMPRIEWEALKQKS